MVITHNQTQSYRECVCVCVCEIKREREREKTRVSVCERERESMTVILQFVSISCFLNVRDVYEASETKQSKILEKKIN